MALYKKLYRIESTRLRTWDYRWNGAYFITICTKNREHFFGEIIYHENSNEMVCSETGKLAWNYWSEIPLHFPYIISDAFTVMPNHTHGILIINNPPPAETLQCNVSDQSHNVSDDMPNLSDRMRNLSESLRNGTDDMRNIRNSSQNANIEEKIKNKTMAEISPKKGSVSAIVRSYKSAVSKKAHLLNPHFEWQERFHDHIIRTEQEFNKIQNYILTNPQKWKEDMFYK